MIKTKSFYKAQEIINALSEEYYISLTWETINNETTYIISYE